MEIRRRFDFGDLMEVEEFKQQVAMTCFTDWDGSCYPVINGVESNDACSVTEIPDEATHVVWYNK